MSLSVGDKVPSFDSTDQNGNSFNLYDLRFSCLFLGR